MVSIGTPQAKGATKIVLLGAGELGKEFVIEAQRLGIETIAIDRYQHAPAMQVAHKSYVIDMLDGLALQKILETEKPTFIVPEIEAIATSVLVTLEQQGYNVIPSAKAVQLTMNREGIRRLAAEELCLPTTKYFIATTQEEYTQAIAQIGLPCVVKPIMSSSGKGQSILRSTHEIEQAWHIAQTCGRGRTTKVIVEEFITFDFEITLLTIRHGGGTSFCEPIGHVQKNGDYRESWQPHPMIPAVLKKAQDIAKQITDALGGYGLFGVEFFVKGNDIYFNEVSPRPHDTGMVTLISQNLSEFSLHLRAILGLPIHSLRQYGPSASNAILVRGKSANIHYHNVEQALQLSDTRLHLFGKPNVDGERRMGVALALGETIQQARQKAAQVAQTLQIELL